MTTDKPDTPEAVEECDAADAAVDVDAQDAAEAARRGELKRIVEALLFSSPRPIKARQLADASGARDGREVRSIVKELAAEYDAAERAFAVEEVAGGFQLMTRPEFAQWVRQLHSTQQQDTLSKAALETLAIVAYRQPVNRADVEDIRGVQCGQVLRALVDRRLLRIVGRSEELGRPLLYGTTRQFLQAFGLRSLSDLPRKAQFGLPARRQGSE
jgi:segregation and condensation protein B